MVSSSKQSLNQRAVVTDTSEAVAPSNQEDNGNDAADILSALPGWLQPGVSPTIHLALRIVLVSLNCILLACAFLRVLSPHFEIMFLLSVALTGLYVMFVIQLENIRRDALVSTGGATSSIATAEVDSDDRSSNKKHN